jgi:uncharacterized integral membrane protein
VVDFPLLSAKILPNLRLLVVLAVVVGVVMALMVGIRRCLGLRIEKGGTKGRQGQN